MCCPLGFPVLVGSALRAARNDNKENDANENERIQTLCEKYSYIAADGDAFKFNDNQVTVDYIKELLLSQEQFASQLEHLYNFVIKEHEKYVEATNTLAREVEELEWNTFDSPI